MNHLFVSPNFPPQFYLFCAALRERGVNVLGLGDAPPWEIRGELRAVLTEYVSVPSLLDDDAVLRAVAGMIHRHGRIHRIDSLNEFWLPLEARLREDFNVAGPRPAETALHRSKLGMARVLGDAGVPTPPTEAVTSLAQTRAFAERHGLPAVLKPDAGVGAQGAFRVDDEAELARAWERGLEGFVMQPFVPGTLTSFDGIADRHGRVVFSSSFVYGSGVMEIVNEGREVFYHTRRGIPPALRDAGERAVRAFGLRERFFHLEFFERPDGTVVALEANLRPPGGYSTDLMNYGADVDVYRLWAAAVTGHDFAGFTYEHKYHCAHASRRRHRPYALSHDELVRALGDTLVLARDMPPAFAPAMGDTVYILRHADLGALMAARELVQGT